MHFFLNCNIIIIICFPARSSSYLKKKRRFYNNKKCVWLLKDYNIALILHTVQQHSFVEERLIGTEFLENESRHRDLDVAYNVCPYM